MSDVERTTLERTTLERRIAALVQPNGKCPVEEWLRSLRDKSTRAKVERQIDKLARGQGWQKNLKGVAELKIDLGPGYRVYYGLLDHQTVVVLLGGGDKSRQSQDIENAKQLWKDFEDAGRAETALRFWNEDPQSENEDPQSEGESKSQ